MFWQRERANGLRDDWWVPVLIVDGRLVADLLEELHRAGIPAYCTWFSSGRPTFRQRWCLWVGGSTYGRAEERLADVLPLLIHWLRHGPATA